MTVSRETPELADKLASRALVQGMVVGGLTSSLADLYSTQEWKIDQQQDPSSGLYLHYMDVTLPSGTVIRVQVEVL